MERTVMEKFCEFLIGIAMLVVVASLGVIIHDLYTSPKEVPCTSRMHRHEAIRHCRASYCDKDGEHTHQERWGRNQWHAVNLMEWKIVCVPAHK